MSECEELLTAEELASRLRVQTSTITEWARRGIVPAIRVTPKVIRFDYRAVLLAVRKCKEVQHD